MKEHHPIDELFAHALGDAVAAPPARVWRGIVRRRGYRRPGALRRWGWLPLLLLMGGTAGWWLAGGNGQQALHPAQMARTTETGGIVEPAAATSTSKEAATMPQAATPAAAERPATTDTTAVAESRSFAADPRLRGDLGEKTAPTSHPGAAQEKRDIPAMHPAPGPKGGQVVISPVAPAPAAASTRSDEAHLQPGRAEPKNRPETAAGSAFAPVVPVLLADPGAAPVRLAVLRASIPGVAAPGPNTPPDPVHRGPRRAIWVAATSGLFTEKRRWKGTNDTWIRALEGTEVPHPATTMGVLVGLEGHRGWNVAVGLEYGVSRYDFHHLDRYMGQRDSLVQYVVTFNSQVVSSHTETVGTYGEVQQRVAAENRFSTWRVPVELGWHKGFGRFHAGMRAGLAAEVNRIRSGATLAMADGGARSVDATDHTTVLLGGTLAADLGYAITEQWGLWATPTIGSGLFPLSSTNDAPYALPRRFGLRLRLAYTLKPSH